MMAPIAAIPTRYAGTQFRSRLEARWAAMFDLLGWRWEYEPIDLRGYIPDFVIEDGRRIVEVKPVFRLAEYERAQRKIEVSGWVRSAACVGAVVGTLYDGTPCIGSEWIECAIWSPWMLWNRGGDEIATLWREASNRVQWRGVGNEARIGAPAQDRHPTEVEVIRRELARAQQSGDSDRARRLTLLAVAMRRGDVAAANEARAALGLEGVG